MVGRSWVLLAMLPVLSHAETGSIQGQVVDPAGAVIANADVVLRIKGDSNPLQTTRTDWPGHFRLTGVPAETYELLVSAAGFNRHSESTKVTEGQEIDLPPISLSIAPIAGCGPPPLAPPTIYSDSINSGEAELYGTVAGVSDEFIARVQVFLLPINDGRRATMVSGPDGSFYFSGIAPGVYRLRATRRGYADFVIDRLELNAGQRIHIIEPLEMLDCLKGFRCEPNRKVHIIELCL